MLPSDAPFLETALALLALPFRPVTAGSCSTLSVVYTASAPCQTHVNYHRQRRWLVKGIKSFFIFLLSDRIASLKVWGRCPHAPPPPEVVVLTDK